MNRTAKKFLALLTVSVVATLGVTSPSLAKSSDSDRGASIMQKMNDQWCC